MFSKVTKIVYSLFEIQPSTKQPRCTLSWFIVKPTDSFKRAIPTHVLDDSTLELFKIVIYSKLYSYE